ncbi:MAG: glycoside hydrolase family 127 protein [Chloroflexi bacterium]|nr:glycoside hydrolase family 127 protein [Chloroflexota bacterium]MCC6891651.1 glycoside hydrolase family 127 protein [Anaerolineae bacterium]
MQPQYNRIDLATVQLAPSLFKDRFELNRAYVMSLTTENLLQNFYLEAGIRDSNFDGMFRVTMYGNSGDGSDRHWGWESPTSEIRGHFVGHWLSAAARIIQVTGDPHLKLKADAVVEGIKRCQAKNGNGWAASIPEKYFQWLALGKPTWAPQYVTHKTMMGLLDMYRYAGNADALAIVDLFADWFVKWTTGFSREEMNAMLDVETGAMLELWSDLYGMTQEAKYLTLMERYTRPRLFEPLLAGKDVLTNMHANTTIPEVHGAARAYEVTGETRWRQIVEAYWQSAVTNRGYFCTGGQTSGEMWTPPFEFAARLGHHTQEHCTVYNMIRLADYLFRWTGEAIYADYIEKNLYNGILAQQNGKTGMVAYYLPIEGGAKKVWGSPTYDFWCCHGTLVQAHTIHNAYIYYAKAGEIAVAQYIPSVLETTQQGIPVTIRQNTIYTAGGVTYNPADLGGDTHRPNHWQVTFDVEAKQSVQFTLKLRLPGWMSGEPTLLVNGEPVQVDAVKSSFVAITRTWATDTISLRLPKSLHTEALPDMPEMCAFVDGPVVLAGLCAEDRTLVGDKEDAATILVPHNERQWGHWLPEYRTLGQAYGLRFKPLFDVTDEAYTVYFQIKAQ